jgi:predicted nucleic acid-binding protein
VTPVDAVIDASVIVRGLTRESERAADLLRGIAAGRAEGHAPDLVVPEVTNALLRYVTTNRSDLEGAVASLNALAACPITLHPSTGLAAGALRVAVALGLSAYDAFYAVLADALEVPLVTADRRLAAAVAGSVLVA